jgi:hypothetical protein
MKEEQARPRSSSAIRLEHREREKNIALTYLHGPRYIERRKIKRTDKKNER